ncbi:osteoglycin, paralog b isoform X1 [Maylandia zebra]|uniref:Mimecan n=3 Tax=Haplochromini TaxID=319058 RepID=A0A3B4F5F7_9CICH|nr:mimecan [Maylandia zebra]XP_005740553.1 PREDICTED: mimecan-like [Pundamilia nyererei]XP_026011080.1 mimecan-like isoform X1 [Astatotilapia calliptera]
MIPLRILIFTYVMLPWIVSSAAKGEYMEARTPAKATVRASDYGVLQDTDTDGGVLPKAEVLPTCLLCVCLSGSVYCEDVSPDMSAVPTLPKETAYLYARFNKITKIHREDFADTATLRRIDLSGNLISEIEDGSFSKLPNLEELKLAENRLTKLPMLPSKLVTFNANFNRLKNQGVKANAFKKLTRLAYLYLGDNELTAVPHLPESLYVVHLHNNNISTITDETFCKGNTSHYIRTNMYEVRLDGNPLKLSEHPNSFICLQSLPIGWYK